MRLIEKECPNCGAGLSFTKEDTTCKCEYCKREFEIERDPEQKKLIDQFSLSELKTPIKLFSLFTFGSFAVQAIVIFIIFIVIVILGFNIVNGLNDSNSIFNRNADLVKKISDLNSSDYSTLDLNSKVLIAKETATTTGSYINKASFKREKLYIISNDKTNYLIPIYKTVYENFSNNSDTHTIYIPIIFKNVRKKSNSIAFYLDNGKISAPEYHFNEHNYSYGYSNLDTLYNELIKKYEKNYRIIEK